MGLPGSGGSFGNGGGGEAGAAEVKADNEAGKKENPLVKMLDR